MPRLAWARDMIMVIAICAAGFVVYPLFISAFYATLMSRHGDGLYRGDDPASREAHVLNSIRIARRDHDSPEWRTPDTLKALLHAPLGDVMSYARISKKYQWDFLNAQEYDFSIEEGLKAARAGCPPNARIATLDLVNPFPLLLGWPEGGGMLFVLDNYLASRKAHPSPQAMFGRIDCILVPELQLVPGTRPFLLDVYGPYIRDNFDKTHESGFWTVWARKA